MINSDKRYYAMRLAVLITAFFIPLLIINSAQANEDTEWRPPNFDSSYTYNGFDTPDAWCANHGQPIVDGGGNNDYAFYAGWRDEPTYLAECFITLNGLFHSSIVTFGLESTTAKCTELDYPIPEDLDGDDTIDHCHKSQCNRNGEMFDANGLTSPDGYVCVAQGNGEYCEHQIGNVDNADGSPGISMVRPTGESCGSNADDFEHADWQPLDENDLPDPSDPNNPPADNGDPSCTAVDGTALNVCNRREEDVCTTDSFGQQQCPSGCGTVNGIFSCIESDDGELAEVTDLDNDNSGTTTDDDPNTQGDEGTHSRLDGLLKNTDGIEGLLQGIKDGLGDIAGGGGDEGTDEPAEEEEECPAGQIDIGNACVLFDKNDQPTQDALNFEEIDQLIADSESELSGVFNDIKTAMDSKFTTALTGGAYTANTVTIKGAQVDFGIARLSGLFDFNLFGSLVMFAFGIRALFVLVGG